MKCFNDHLSNSKFGGKFFQVFACKMHRSGTEPPSFQLEGKNKNKKNVSPALALFYTSISFLFLPCVQSEDELVHLGATKLPGFQLQIK